MKPLRSPQLNVRSARCSLAWSKHSTKIAVADNVQITKVLACKVYFAKQYHSLEHGSIENLKGNCGASIPKANSAMTTHAPTLCSPPTSSTTGTARFSRTTTPRNASNINAHVNSNNPHTFSLHLYHRMPRMACSLVDVTEPIKRRKSVLKIDGKRTFVKRKLTHQTLAKVALLKFPNCCVSDLKTEYR